MNNLPLFVVYLSLFIIQGAQGKAKPNFFANALMQNLYTTKGLSAPYNVRVEIEKDTAVVSWDHIESDSSLKGYYVTLEDIGSGQKESPAYVHVNSGIRCANVIGLRPGTVYRLMVN